MNLKMDALGGQAVGCAAVSSYLIRLKPIYQCQQKTENFIKLYLSFPLDNDDNYSIIKEFSFEF